MRTPDRRCVRAVEHPRRALGGHDQVDAEAFAVGSDLEERRHEVRVPGRDAAGSSTTMTSRGKVTPRHARWSRPSSSARRHRRVRSARCASEVSWCITTCGSAAHAPNVDPPARSSERERDRVGWEAGREAHHERAQQLALAGARRSADEHVRAVAVEVDLDRSVVTSRRSGTRAWDRSLVARQRAAIVAAPRLAAPSSCGIGTETGSVLVAGAREGRGRRAAPTGAPSAAATAVAEHGRAARRRRRSVRAAARPAPDRPSCSVTSVVQRDGHVVGALGEHDEPDRAATASFITGRNGAARSRHHAGLVDHGQRQVVGSRPDLAAVLGRTPPSRRPGRGRRAPGRRPTCDCAATT